MRAKLQEKALIYKSWVQANNNKIKGFLYRKANSYLLCVFSVLCVLYIRSFIWYIKLTTQQLPRIDLQDLKYEIINMQTTPS